MIKRLALLVFALLATPVWAESYKVEPLAEKAPGELGGSVGEKMSPSGFRVVNADNDSVVCEIWLLKSFTVKPGFKPTNNVLYPMEPNSLVGALRFTKKGADFRGQPINPGVYTLRYALQPETGTHVGTFETRDFLVMLQASSDQDVNPITSDDDIANASSKAADSAHPAVMPLMKAEGAGGPTMNHYQANEWWTVKLPGKDDQGRDIPIEVVVVGKAAE